MTMARATNQANDDDATIRFGARTMARKRAGRLVPPLTTSCAYWLLTSWELLNCLVPTAYPWQAPSQRTFKTFSCWDHSDIDTAPHDACVHKQINVRFSSSAVRCGLMMISTCSLDISGKLVCCPHKPLLASQNSGIATRRTLVAFHS